MSDGTACRYLAWRLPTYRRTAGVVAQRVALILGKLLLISALTALSRAQRRALSIGVLCVRLSAASAAFLPMTPCSLWEQAMHGWRRRR